MKKVIFILLLLSSSICFSNPTGEQVVSGAVSVSREDSTTTINQTSNTAIINWEDFSIDSDETTNFIQPSINASILSEPLTNSSSTARYANSISSSLRLNNAVFTQSFCVDSIMSASRYLASSKMSAISPSV